MKRRIKSVKPSERGAFNIVNTVIMCVMMVITVYPIWFAVINSLPQCQVMNSKKGKKYPLSIKRRGDICNTNYNLFAFQRIHKIAAKRA